jgi:hypothetical protein
VKARKTGFSFDDEENLNSILFSDSWQTLLKLFDKMQAGFERHLIQYPLSEGAEKLLLEKARVEGSARLIAELKKFRELRVKDTQRQLPKP